MAEYKSYIDSQIPYVGAIPSHWKTVQNKRVMHKEKRICDSYAGQDIISLTLNGVIVRDLGAGGKMPATFDGYQFVYPGELLMCLFDIDVTPRCVGRVFNEGLTSPAYSSFVLHENADLGYFYYYYLMLDHKKELLHLAKNLRHSLTEEQLGQIKVLLPPLDEQLAIAAYLDDEITRVNVIITEAKTSIEEFKQWKSAIINEVVTKGFNSSVEMKDTGTKWLPQIPIDWEIGRLKDNFSFGKGLPITKADLVDDGIAVISYGQIHAKTNSGTHMAQHLLRFVPDSYLETNPASLLEKGDIVLADTSEDLDGLGNAVLMDSDDTVFAGYHTIIMRPYAIDYAKYFSYLFRTDYWRSQLRANASGIKVFSATQKMLRSCSVILPCKEDRDAITTYLDVKCKKIDEIIIEKQALITELENYKKSLVYDVVTGKRKVV